MIANVRLSTSQQGRSGALVLRMAGKGKGNPPKALDNHPSAIVLFNNLASLPATTFRCPTEDDAKAALALELDRVMREHAPAGWKGDATRETEVRNALFPFMNRDREATRAIFDIIKQQPGYSSTRLSNSAKSRSL